jgi:hypothetical protein
MGGVPAALDDLSPDQLAALELLRLEELACPGFGDALLLADEPPRTRAQERRAVRAAARSVCRPAPTCTAVLREATARAPARSRASDGICGDAAHQARPSDHNPAADGYAHAVDVTHDPGDGMDAHGWAEAVRFRVLAGLERRVKYIISNRRICSAFEGWRWRPYSGVNPHTLHAHVSVTIEATHDASSWFEEAPPAGQARVVSAAWHRPAFAQGGVVAAGRPLSAAEGREVFVRLPAPRFRLGLPFAGTDAATPRGVAVPLPTPSGYWMAGPDGAVYAFGSAPYMGGANGGPPLAGPIVAIVALPRGDGYWLVGADGGVFAFGNARFDGSLGGVPLNRPIVGAAATPTGLGYWLVAADGGVFCFGDARFHGSTGGAPLVAPVVGIAPTEAGEGYWLAAADGGVFSFGDAGYKGNGRGVATSPVVAVAGTSTGEGYWLLTRGAASKPPQLLHFGDAAAFPAPAAAPVALLALDGGGYAVQPDGGLLTFGTAPWFGSLPGWPNA